ncbi:MAG: alpha/beta hydrolase [Patescibacteria group bacterium]
MNVVVNGLMTSYQKVGKGPVIVCLHGWGDSAATFSKLAENLRGKYQLLILDLPGFGGTQKPTTAWGLEDYANFVAAWLKKLDAGEINAIIGHSFGGAVAIKAVSTLTLKPSKLVLLASAGVREKKSLRLGILRTGAKVAKVPLYILPAHKATKIKTYFYHKAGSDLMLSPHMRQTFVKTIREDLRQTASSIKLPTLLIYGNQDRETPSKDGQLLNEAIPDSRLEIINAGHFLHQEQVGEVSNLILEFLEQKE